MSESNWISVEFSCRSCRKCKPASRETSVCKHRSDSFSPLYNDKPCVEWLPVKSDLRLKLEIIKMASPPKGDK